MKILSEQEFSTKLVSEATDSESPKSRILINELETDTLIDGAVFEACIQFHEYYLVFTTDDCPFEESLNIYLLDQKYCTLDHATLFWPYGTGSFKLLDIVEPNIARFKFFEEKIWKIKLYLSKRLVIPYISEPGGVWRKFKLKHHFKVSKKYTPKEARRNLTKPATSRPFWKR